MLRRFSYLDTEALDDYLSAIEGGSLVSHETRSTKTNSGHGGLDIKVVSAGGEHVSELADTRSMSDTHAAQFDRLLAAAEDDPDGLGWVNVADADVDLPDAKVGRMVCWNCDVRVHPLSEALSKSGEFASLLGLVDGLAPVAKALGLSVDGLPTDGERQAMGAIMDGIDAPKVILGESDDSSWTLVCPIKEQFASGIVAGPACVVGKVIKVLKVGEWQHIVTIPGVNLLPREERRKLDKAAPAAGHEDEYVQGPVLVLDLLAIYR